VHGEARRLLEEKMLKQQRASRDSNPDCEGIRPSLFALDAEAPGELVPDVPANRYGTGNPHTFQCCGSGIRCFLTTGSGMSFSKPIFLRAE
jgi:hypothetical protein